MKILEVKSLAIPDVKVIRYQRFRDERGYFTETFRLSDMQNHPQTQLFHGVSFFQYNESRSAKGVIRGLHFQWNPFMGKLVRTLCGRMVDLVLDIRKGSPTFGKILAYDLPAKPDKDYSEWIWVPVGFAHGNYFTEETTIEYFCTGEWSPQCEAGICPLSSDIDWSLADPNLRREFHALAADNPLLSPKDKAGFTLSQWLDNPDGNQFIYSADVSAGIKI